jgi:hypothetical protein
MICRPGAAAAAAAEGLSRSLAGGFNPGPDLEFNLTTQASRTRKLKPEPASVQRPLRGGGAGNSHSSTSLQGLHSLAVQLASELEA